jgi:hypothetical protein
MNEQKLIAELRFRATLDAQAFRDQNPNDRPTERWIENSYTAAFPLARDTVGFDPGQGPHPHLFDAYRREIHRHLGERRPARDTGDELVQAPTPGEH